MSRRIIFFGDSITDCARNYSDERHMGDGYAMLVNAALGYKYYKPLLMDTGKGYFIFGRPHFELITAELTDDFTEVTGKYQTNYSGMYPPYAREVPTYFARDGIRYLITSVARYVWLPIQWDNEKPVIYWKDEWKLPEQ